MVNSTPALLGLTSAKDIIFASLKCCRLRGKLDLLHTLCELIWLIDDRMRPTAEWVPYQAWQLTVFWHELA